MTRARRALGILALGALLACGGSGRDPWIARVDDAEIRRSELLAEVEARAQDGAETPRREILYDELERLVVEQVVLNRAEELGLEVSDSEVEERLAELFGEQAFMADTEYRERVRREMLLERTALVELGPRVRVSDSDVLLRFEEQRQGFGQPERIQVRQIVVQDQALARRLLGELRSGADFGELAHEWSIGPEAAEGGLLPPFARGELPEAFDAAFKLRTGKLSDVVESPYGFHVFRLERRIPAEEASLEAVQERIRQDLERERLEELRRGLLGELRAGATIRVNEPVLEELE